MRQWEAGQSAIAGFCHPIVQRVVVVGFSGVSVSSHRFGPKKGCQFDLAVFEVRAGCKAWSLTDSANFKTPKLNIKTLQHTH